MGIFKKAVKGIKNTVKKAITKPTSAFKAKTYSGFLKDTWDHTGGTEGLGNTFDKMGHGLKKFGNNLENMAEKTWDWVETQAPKVGSVINSATGATEKHDWAVQDANTAHQREIEDLKAAGLNPILAAGATGGAGGATVQENPAGSAQMAMSGISDIIQGATAIADINLKNEQAELTAKQAGKNQKEIESMDIQNDIAKNIASAEVKLKSAQTEKEKEQVAVELQKSLALEFDNKMKEMNVKMRSTQYDKELEKYKQTMMKQMIQAGYDNTTIGRIINSIGSTINALSPFTEFTGQSNSARSANTYNYTNVNY